MRARRLASLVLTLLLPAPFAATTAETPTPQAMVQSTVLGLPLGAKLPKYPRCPQAGEDRIRCWVDGQPKQGRPFSGFLALPSSEARPGWATHAMFLVNLTHDGILTSVTVRSFEKDHAVITKSINARYGMPSWSKTDDSSLQAAEWDRPEAYVSSYCQPYRNVCSVTFEEPSTRRARESKRKDEAAAKPIAP